VVADYQDRVHQARVSTCSRTFHVLPQVPHRCDQMTLPPTRLEPSELPREGITLTCLRWQRCMPVRITLPRPDHASKATPLILALMRMPAGTGAEAHCASNEQRIHVIEGYSAPPWVTHNSVKATPEADGVFFTAKDSSHGLQGTKAL
jgi:hypothetical protein